MALRRSQHWSQFVSGLVVLTADGCSTGLVKLAFNKGKSIADEFMRELLRKGRLHKVRALRLKDLPVCLDAVYKQCLVVGKVQVSNNGRIGEFARPLAKEFRKPRNLKELCSLSEKEGIVLLTTLAERYESQGWVYLLLVRGDVEGGIHRRDIQRR